MKKKDYGELDASILALVSNTQHRPGAILENDVVRRAAMRVTRRRAGTSPAESTDQTVMDRLNVLRLAGQISFDHATGRWNKTAAPAPYA